MRTVLLTVLVLSLLTASLPGVHAETYRYVSVPAPGPECRDDPLGDSDGLCFGSVTFAIGDMTVLSIQDDVFGQAAHYVCYHDGSGCDADSRTEPFACTGSRVVQDGQGATHVTVLFPVIVALLEDLSVCGATTGTVTVDP